MTSFIAFTLAVLLGLVSSQAVSDTKLENLVVTPTLQSDFVYNSDQLAMPWDTETLNSNAASCQVYEDLTLFNLTSIRGPYYVEVDLDNDVNASKEKLEVHFCNPVRQNQSIESRSLVYLRNTETADPQLKRAVRLTSGDNSFSSKNLITNATDDIIGINLVAKYSSDISITRALCQSTTNWTISFNVICNESESGPLSYDKFSFAKDSDKCTLEFNAINKAGCGTFKQSGIIQIISNTPIIAGFMIFFGICIGFCANQIMEKYDIALPVTLSSIFATIVVSSFGLFSVLEEDIETTGFDIFMAIIGLAIIIGFAYFIGCKAKRYPVLEKIATAIISMWLLTGPVASISKSLFKFLPPKAITSIRSWFSGSIGFILSCWLNQAYFTGIIGAVLSIRGLYFFVFGRFPNEIRAYDQVNQGRFNLPPKFWLYVLFICLFSWAGWTVQFYYDAAKAKREKELKDAEEAQNQRLRARLLSDVYSRPFN